MDKKMTYIFVLILTFFMSANLLIEDKELSTSERRPLKDFPEFSKEVILNGEFTDSFEDYALDQFILRDGFRSIKAYIELYVLNKNDINDIYYYENHLIKRVTEYNDKSVFQFTDYIINIANQFDDSSNIYYMVIPDKNYFVKKPGYQTIDYEDLFTHVNDELKEFIYISVEEVLSIEDYYLTDTHWRQEKLGGLLELMSVEMDVEFKDISHYQLKTYDDFYGVYASQSGLGVSPDTLYYLVSDFMEDMIVINYEYSDAEHEIYETEALGDMDSYDVFLGGASPLITIENPNSGTDRELIFFRDSFGSSLAPLLTENYAKVTLVDTRYISSDLLTQYIEFGNQDVLFMYNTEVINNSQMLR